ncbi:hypothetical protein SH661x_003430 [Planctomicrobium sp. SH661]|uniref:hypothetical protein n=1 Tax=Planctomicrobium sp. SH661 TaxID=3448124 RepID=UPI003F5B9E3D
MPTIQHASQVLDRHYLEMRCGILDLAAALDRISRSDQADVVKDDPRLARIQEALKIVASSGTDRAERIQLLFSDQYVEGWNRK